MKPGPRPTPSKLKIARGRPRVDDEPVPKSPMGDPPKWLDAEARDCWRRLVANLEELGIAARVDADAAANYCESYSRWKQAVMLLRKQGSVYSTSTGYLAQRPEVSIAKNLLVALNRYQCEFGLTPSARTRVKVSQKADARDVMASLVKVV